MPRQMGEEPFPIKDWSTAKLSEEYKKLLTLSVSDTKRFEKGVEIYGGWAIYESIILASGRTLTGDPLNYVLSVAHAKWREGVQESEQEAKYLMRVNIAKERSQQDGKELEEKIKRAKKKKNAFRE